MVNELKQALSAWILIQINFQKLNVKFFSSFNITVITLQVASNHNNGLAD